MAGKYDLKLEERIKQKEERKKERERIDKEVESLTEIYSRETKEIGFFLREHQIEFLKVVSNLRGEIEHRFYPDGTHFYKRLGTYLESGWFVEGKDLEKVNSIYRDKKDRNADEDILLKQAIKDLQESMGILIDQLS